MNRTFFQQLFYTFFLIILLSVVLYIFLTIGVVKRALNRETLERQMTMTVVVANQIPLEGFSSNRDAQIFCDSIVKNTIVRMTLVDRSGNVIADTSKDRNVMNDHSNRPEVRQALFVGVGNSTRFSNTLSLYMLYTAVSIEDKDLVVRLSQPVEQIRNDLDRIYTQILLIFVLSVFLGTISSFFMARSASGSLTAVREVVTEYAMGNFETELDLTGSREAVILSRSVNAMGRQLQDKISTVTYQKNELKGMLYSMKEPVVLLDHQLEVKEMNPAAIEMLLNNQDDTYLGKGILQVMRSVEACELAEKILKSKKSQEDLIHFKEHDSYLQVFGSFLYRDEETPPSVMLVMNDITRIKKLEEMRKDFVANVSHELRTPVTSIMGYVETLQGGALDYRDRAKQFVDVIFRQTRNLNALIDDLLTLSHIEDGCSRFKMEEFPVCDLLSSAISVSQHKANERKSCISLICECENLLQGHPVLLEQAVSNLIENAIKYCPEETQINVCGETLNGMVNISVEDHGPGIPEKDLDRIFERFYRVDKARNREMGGTGLGLAIVKHISVIHNGVVSVSSREGLGCTFTISLPVRQPEV